MNTEQFKVNFRKMGDSATKTVFVGKMQECRDFVADHFPSFKESEQNGVPYFFKVRGSGIKGEVCIAEKKEV